MGLHMEPYFALKAFALGMVTPWGRDSRSEGWLQEPRGRAVGAHGWPCNIARPHMYVRERPKEISGLQQEEQGRTP